MPSRPILTGDKSQAPLDARIFAVATDLFIRHGYKAVSFLAIAKQIGTTHSHIHYYFHAKAILAEAVLNAYVASTTVDFRTIWIDPYGTGGRAQVWPRLAENSGE